jgi:hypothetical protein
MTESDPNPDRGKQILFRILKILGILALVVVAIIGIFLGTCMFILRS